MAKRKKPTECFGFDGPGTCKNPPGSKYLDGSERSAYWCQECDDKRIAEISASFEEITKSYEERTVSLHDKVEVQVNQDPGKEYWDSGTVALVNHQNKTFYVSFDKPTLFEGVTLYIDSKDWRKKNGPEAELRSR